jgi:hypothetical protein
MKFKRTFEPFDHNVQRRTGMSMGGGSRVADGQKGSFNSQLPQVYSGPPNRIERYAQYDHMDLDSQVSASLDIISEFSTHLNEDDDIPFRIIYKEELNPSQTKILRSALKKWCSINKFKHRIYDIFRNTIKYGDCFFVRDPETYEWLYIFPNNVEKIEVNEARGKRPETYWIRNFDYNAIAMTVSSNPIIHSGSYPAIPLHNAQVKVQSYYSRSDNTQYGNQSRFQNTSGSLPVNADYVIHLSMNTGLDANFPFGTSILERIYKTFKQKELIEDSIIIYRIQRAPERRIFYINIGDLEGARATAMIERMKNEIHQRRIPSKNSNKMGMMDATYNPLSVLEDYFLPVNSEGNGHKIETLPGGDTRWGLDELQYFDNKLGRGLRIPVSYLPTGPEESSQPFTDGRVGNALIQELRFAKHCERLQDILSGTFDQEFKLFLKAKDFDISAGAFEIKFNEPQDFSAWRKIDIDASRINNFTSLTGSATYISKRLAMKEYLGWDEGKINENTRMFIEENPKLTQQSQIAKYMNQNRQDIGLQDVGFSPSQFPGGDLSDDDFEVDSGSDMSQTPEPLEPLEPLEPPEQT